jgi:type I restriction enzyme S subunit
MLKINGKCAVVLPDGQDLFSKTNTTLVTIREYLMKTCDLKEIIYLPSGIFTYTSIKTCVFYFVKKREGTDVLETDIKYSKVNQKENQKVNQKETGRDYKFSKTHQTTKVKFYDYNPYEDVKNLLVEVPIEKIVSNSYSLNYAEYMKDENDEEQYEDGVVVKTLGEVCSIDYGTRIVKGNNTEGEYPVFGSGRAMFSTNTFNREGYNILIGRFALSLECVRFINEKIFLNDSGLSIKPKTDILLHKYIGYYLLHNQSIIYNCARGTAQKNLEMDIFKSIKIPIPSLERQQEIVKYLDFIYEKANKTSISKIAELKQLNEFCLSNQKIFGENVVKTLEELCNMSVKGNTNSKEISNTGEYPFYKASVSNPSGTHNTFCFDDIEYLLFIKSGGNSSNPLSLSHGIGKVYLVNGKSSGNTEVVKIKNNELVMLKYLYYYLQNEQLNIQKLAKYSTNLGHIDMNRFKEFKIPVPSFERQKEIVEYCEYNDTLINQLEKEIENNKKQAQQFITGIVKAQVQTEEQSDTSSVNTEPIDEVQNEIVSVEEEIIIEPKPKVKKIVKKVKKPLVIVEEDNEV